MGQTIVKRWNWKCMYTYLIFEGVDKSQVVESDVIVVILDVTESFLVVLH